MEKSNIYGIIGSAIFCLLTFLILWFVVMPAPVIPEEDEGIMVSFGDSPDGAGLGDGGVIKTDIDNVQPAPALSVPKPAVASRPQELLTQDNENTIAIATQKKKEREKQRELEIQKLEQQRQVAAAAAEQKRQQEAIAKANDLMGGSFGKGGGSGSGTTAGDTRQGNPAGSGTSGGHGWSLSGRSLVGSLATPSYPSNVEGKVTVAIRVDANGHVTNASVGSPTTISDAQTRNAAVSAARNTRFSGGSGVSVGTITYNFKLK
ncbi:MAG TPA: TonB family protein [Paludibacteraceae bacterium]|nr:TonB family protein [Paludibacteraceae bacterium]HPT43651.1 TonB family protein [Paludibacteraceae bacterium]